MSTIRPMLEKIILTRVEVRTVRGIRDGLLPRLLSGELAISDAERSVAVGSA